MNPDPDFATAAALLVEPARAAMLARLLDGRAWTATELAKSAGVAPSTASAHLNRLLAGGWVPTLANAFHASFQSAQWIILAYLLAITALIVSVGRLGDLVGRRNLLLSGIALFTVASLLCGIAPSLGVLIAARALQGLGAAIMMALTLAMVGGTVPKERVGSAMGLLGSMSAIGTTLGPSLGGMLTAALGWRSIFLINLPLGLVNFLLVYGHGPSDQPRDVKASGSFDVVGTALMALALGSYALAMTLGRGHFGALNLTLVLASAVCGVLFLVSQQRALQPLLKWTMFRDLRLSGSLAMSCLVAAVMMSTLVVGPFFLSRALGLAPGKVGVALSFGPLVAAAIGVPAGRIVDRYGAPRMTLLALAGMAFGALLLAFAPGQPSILGYLGPIGILTAHYALFQSANNTSLLGTASTEDRGVVSGMISLSRYLGLITGASVMGAVFARGSASPDIMAADPGSIVRGMHTTFAVAGGMLIAAMVIARSTRRSLGAAI